MLDALKEIDTLGFGEEKVSTSPASLNESPFNTEEKPITEPSLFIVTSTPYLSPPFGPSISFPVCVQFVPSQLYTLACPASPFPGASAFGAPITTISPLLLIETDFPL